jgi:hypothetical protein
MFGPQHAPAGLSCLSGLRMQAPRVPPAASHTPTCARITKVNHAWPTACPSSRSVMPEWAQKAPRSPPAACQTPTCARMAKTNNVWPIACHKENLQLLPQTKCKNGENESLHVVEKPTSIIFGPKHANAGQSCLKGAREATRMHSTSCP